MFTQSITSVGRVGIIKFNKHLNQVISKITSPQNSMVYIWYSSHSLISNLPSLQIRLGDIIINKIATGHDRACKKKILILRIFLHAPLQFWALTSTKYDVYTCSVGCRYTCTCTCSVGCICTVTTCTCTCTCTPPLCHHLVWNVPIVCRLPTLTTCTCSLSVVCLHVHVHVYKSAVCLHYMYMYMHVCSVPIPVCLQYIASILK